MAREHPLIAETLVHRPRDDRGGVAPRGSGEGAHREDPGRTRRDDQRHRASSNCSALRSSSHSATKPETSYEGGRRGEGLEVTGPPESLVR